MDRRGLSIVFSLLVCCFMWQGSIQTVSKVNRWNILLNQTTVTTTTTTTTVTTWPATLVATGDLPAPWVGTVAGTYLIQMPGVFRQIKISSGPYKSGPTLPSWLNENVCTIADHDHFWGVIGPNSTLLTGPATTVDPIGTFSGHDDVLMLDISINVIKGPP